MSTSLWKLLSTCVVLCLLGLGCAGIEKKTSARSGPYPSNYKQIVSDWLDAYLAFPQDVKDVRAGEPQFFENEKESGYFLRVFYTPKTADSKNGLRHMTTITIQHGRVVKVEEPVAAKKIKVYDKIPPPQHYQRPKFQLGAPTELKG